MVMVKILFGKKESQILWLLANENGLTPTYLMKRLKISMLHNISRELTPLREKGLVEYKFGEENWRERKYSISRNFSTLKKILSSDKVTWNNVQELLNGQLTLSLMSDRGAIKWETNI